MDSEPNAYTLGRIQIIRAMNICAMKMAAVFVTSTSAISLRARTLPRRMALFGFALVLVLLVNVRVIQRTLLVFPL